LFKSSGSAYKLWTTYSFVGTSTQPVVFKADTLHQVTIDMPSNLVGSYLFQVEGNISFQGINFTNSNKINQNLLILNNVVYNNPNIYFSDCTFDWNEATSSPLYVTPSFPSGHNATVTFERGWVRNIGPTATHGFFWDNINSTYSSSSVVLNVNFKAFLVYNIPALWSISAGGTANMSLTNITAASFNGPALGTTASNENLTIVNSIIRADATFYEPITDFSVPYATLKADFHINNTAFYYNGVLSDPGGPLDKIVTGAAVTDIFPYTQTMYYINPNFVAEGTLDGNGNMQGSNFHINPTTGSYLSGRGDGTQLPAEDADGNPWTGNDIGAYANPAAGYQNGIPANGPAFPTINPGTASFVGDSIAEGLGNNIEISPFNWTNVLGNSSGCAGTATCAAVGGSVIQSLGFLIDRAALTWGSQAVLVIDADNNFTPAGNAPTNITYAEAAAVIETAMKKAAYWGIKPIWLGMGGSIDGTATKGLALNGAVTSLLQADGYTYGSWLNQFMLSPSWTNGTGATPPGYYCTNSPTCTSGLSGGNVHPAPQGYQLMAELADYYFYYPHHQIGTNKINVGAGARIYADGTFRDLGTTSSSTATLSITPQGGMGQFNTNDQSFWLDITNVTNWTNSNKTWMESNAASSSMVTNHTVGDLDNNAYYIITVTGASASNISGINGTLCNTISGNAVCQSNSGGALSFQYNGGYSTHTFNMTEYSSDASLSALTVSSGTLSPTFSSSTTSYTVVLPHGTVSAPTVTATTDDPNATDTVTQASSPTGSATVLVTAQDGITTSTYSISFTVAPTPVSITSFSLVATSTSLTVPIVSLTASGTVAGYFFSESATTPSSTALGWTATVPASYIFQQAGSSRTLYAWVKDSSGNVSSPASATVSFPYYAIAATSSVQTLVSSGIVTSTASSVASTTAITFNDPVQVSIGASTVSISSGTIMTTASTSNFTTIVATTTVVTNNLPANSGILGTVQYGLASSSIALNQLVTITIPVDASYNGQTLPVYQSEDGGISWTSLTTCLITNGICSFTTSNLSSFAVIVPLATSGGSGGGGGGGGSLQSNIAIVKTVDNANPATGAVIHYTLTVTDGGPSDSSNVVASDTLPSGLIFNSASSSEGSYASSTGIWTIGTIPNGKSATLTITATVTGAPGTIITNTGTVSENPGILNETPQNDISRASITVAGGTTTASSSSPSSTLSAPSGMTIAQMESLLASLETELQELEVRAGSAVGISSPYIFTTDLQLHDTGSAVNALQSYLIREDQGPAAEVLKTHGATNYFGILTYNALVEFQTSVGIHATGYFGSITRKYINSL
jgi:uncharacterized repeat protein (TIGR01451 family)